MNTPFTATLPLPHRDLSPQAARRLHWSAKREIIAAGRKEAWYWFRRQKPPGWAPCPVRIEVEYRCPPKCRGYAPRDIQNAIAAMKPMIDGMVDAGVVADDSDKWLRWGEFRFNRSSDVEPGVVINVTPL